MAHGRSFGWAVLAVFWRLIFLATPAKWICGGCGWWLPGWRGAFGRFVTEKYGWYGDA